MNPTWKNCSGGWESDREDFDWAKRPFRTEPSISRRRLVSCSRGWQFESRAGWQMQELVLVQPGRTAGRLAAANDNDRFAAGYSNDRPTGARVKEEELVREAAQADTRREFEERLAECGPLAYRVARGVLRNTADAE